MKNLGIKLFTVEEFNNLDISFNLKFPEFSKGFVVTNGLEYQYIEDRETAQYKIDFLLSKA